jgi:predicted nucleic acid-binding protein
MSSFVLIDSSAWIEIMRTRKDLALAEEISALLFEGKVAMTPPVWLELFQGIRGKQEAAHLDNLKSLCHWLDFNEECWTRASLIAQKALRQGIHVPTGDILVFACSLHYKTRLLHRDRHFDFLSKVE